MIHSTVTDVTNSLYRLAYNSVDVCMSEFFVVKRWISAHFIQYLADILAYSSRRLVEVIKTHGLKNDFVVGAKFIYVGRFMEL